MTMYVYKKLVVGGFWGFWCITRSFTMILTNEDDLPKVLSAPLLLYRRCDKFSGFLSARETRGKDIFSDEIKLHMPQGGFE